MFDLWKSIKCVDLVRFHYKLFYPLFLLFCGRVMKVTDPGGKSRYLFLQQHSDSFWRILRNFQAIENTISPMSESAQGSFSIGTCPENLKVAVNRYPDQMLEPPHLTAVNVEEQRLDSKFLMSKAEPGFHYRGTETHFIHLFTGSSLGYIT